MVITVFYQNFGTLVERLATPELDQEWPTQYKIKKFGMDWILVQGEQCLWVFMWTLNLVLMAADKTTCAYFICPSSICLIM